MSKPKAEEFPLRYSPLQKTGTELQYIDIVPRKNSRVICSSSGKQSLTYDTDRIPRRFCGVHHTMSDIRSEYEPVE